MPEDAFIEFPPGLGARSSSWTGMLCEISCEAAARPARPDPTTITGGVWESSTDGVVIAVVTVILLL